MLSIVISIMNNGKGPNILGVGESREVV